MKDVSLKELLEAGCHFGHRTNKWNPKASRFIYKPVGDTHIIDLAQTKILLEAAGAFVQDAVASGKEVLFVGTKRQAAAIVKEEAVKGEAPFINQRWIGGLITNWSEVKKNIDQLKELREMLANQKTAKVYTKRERLLMERKMNKLAGVYGGLITLERTPDIIFIVDCKKEITAVREANQQKIPVVGIVDTNTDPSAIAYPIPANDDAVGSIQFLVRYMASAYAEGRKLRKLPTTEQGVKQEEKASIKDSVKPAAKKVVAEKKQAPKKTT